jgi:hypothetical protein
MSKLKITNILEEHTASYFRLKMKGIMNTECIVNLIDNMK